MHTYRLPIYIYGLIYGLEYFKLTFTKCNREWNSRSRNMCSANLGWEIFWWMRKILRSLKALSHQGFDFIGLFWKWIVVELSHTGTGIERLKYKREDKSESVSMCFKTVWVDVLNDTRTDIDLDLLDWNTAQRREEGNRGCGDCRKITQSRYKSRCPISLWSSYIFRLLKLNKNRDLNIFFELNVIIFFKVFLKGNCCHRNI